MAKSPENGNIHRSAKQGLIQMANGKVRNDEVEACLQHARVAACETVCPMVSALLRIPLAPIWTAPPLPPRRAVKLALAPIKKWLRKPVIELCYRRDIR